MPRRISVTSRGDFDNSSDPAAGTLSSGSNVGNDDPARGNSDPIAPGTDANDGAPDEAARIEELRAILRMQDASIEDLRAILRENDRASENSWPRPTTPTRPPVPVVGRDPWSWLPCQPAPSRPGSFRVGGPIETEGTYNIGTTDEMDLEIKRIEVVSQVQNALHEKLGYNLRDSGQYEEMERMYQEGEQMLASTGPARRDKKVLPAMMMWEAPPVSRTSMSRKEPALPEPMKPLPLPPFFGEHDKGAQGGRNGEICLGKFVDTGPNHDEDEEKREEFSVDHESWADVSIDAAPLGPYEHAVRCRKCRAGLKVHIEVGLVACPRCRAISSATESAMGWLKSISKAH